MSLNTPLAICLLLHVSVIADDGRIPRVIEFGRPEWRGMGVIVPRSKNLLDMTAKQRNELQVFPLRGRRAIPDGTRVHIALEQPDQDLDLQILDKFSANEVVGVVVNSNEFTAGELKRLSRFTTLQFLHLQSNSATLESEFAPLKELTAIREIRVTGDTFRNLRLPVSERFRKEGRIVMQFSNPELSNADLKNIIEKNPSITALIANGKTIDDSALRHFVGLDRLEQLKLSGANVTGAGLRHLIKVDSLKKLSLRGCALTDQHTGKLSSLVSLRQLDLSNTGITDETVRRLGTLTRLNTLNLSSTPITGAGFSGWERLNELRILYLSGTRLQDSSVKHLKHLSRLEDVTVFATPLTNASLEHFSQIKSLQRIPTNASVVSSSTKKGITIEGVQNFLMHHPEFMYTDSKIGGYLMRKPVQSRPSED